MKEINETKPTRFYHVTLSADPRRDRNFHTLAVLATCERGAELAASAWGLLTSATTYPIAEYGIRFCNRVLTDRIETPDEWAHRVQVTRARYLRGEPTGDPRLD